MMKVKYIVFLLLVQFFAISCIDDRENSLVQQQEVSYENSKDEKESTDSLKKLSAEVQSLSKQLKEYKDSTWKLPTQVESLESRLNTCELLNKIYFGCIVILLAALAYIYFIRIKELESRCTKSEHKLDNFKVRLDNLHLEPSNNDSEKPFHDAAVGRPKENNTSTHNHQHKSSSNNNSENHDTGEKTSEYLFEESSESLGVTGGSSSPIVYGVSNDKCIKESKDKSQYVIININGDNAEFKYAGSIDDLKANSRVLDNICDYDGSYKNSTNYKSVRNGKCHCVGNGRWEIVEKSKIKFE